MNYMVVMCAALRSLYPPHSPPASRGVDDACYPLATAWRPADPTLSLVSEEEEESLELDSLDSSSDGIPRDLPCNLGAEPSVKSGMGRCLLSASSQVTPPLKEQNSFDVQTSLTPQTSS